MCYFRYPDREQLQSIYSSYLKPILHRQLSRHPVWSNNSKIHALAGSMVQLYDEVCSVIMPPFEEEGVYCFANVGRFVGLLVGR